MENWESYQKSGYLTGDYRLFHLTDTSLREFEFHYHDFYKILLVVSGNVSYIVEGRQYDLLPLDMLLIRAGQIHRPVDHGGVPYTRIILYLSKAFFEKNSSADTDLFYCFTCMEQQQSSLIRLKKPENSPFSQMAAILAETCHSTEYGADLYQKVQILEFLILLNRSLYEKQADYTPPVTAHPAVYGIMCYINDHITEDLSIEKISDSMFLNRSYAMHLFKAETGYTIGRYITEKRLFLFGQYRKQGLSVTEACYLSGFKNYSAFYHANRKFKQERKAP